MHIKDIGNIFELLGNRSPQEFEQFANCQIDGYDNPCGVDKSLRWDKPRIFQLFRDFSLDRQTMFALDEMFSSNT